MELIRKSFKTRLIDLGTKVSDDNLFLLASSISYYSALAIAPFLLIIQGVEEGIGRAVMSRHLIEGNKKIRIVKGFKRYLRPVVLHYYERAYYPKLQKLVLNEFSSSF